MKLLIKTLIKVLTPFIVSVIDAINGVLMYLSYKGLIEVDKKIFSSLDHLVGSSILLIAYIITRSSHMCKYYKMSCYLLIVFHVYAEIYIFTDITFHWYVYVSWAILALSFMFSVIYILGEKTRKLIRLSYKRAQK